MIIRYSISDEEVEDVKDDRRRDNAIIVQLAEKFDGTNSSLIKLWVVNLSTKQDSSRVNDVITSLLQSRFGYLPGHHQRCSVRHHYDD